MYYGSNFIFLELSNCSLLFVEFHQEKWNYIRKKYAKNIQKEDRAASIFPFFSGERIKNDFLIN